MVQKNVTADVQHVSRLDDDEEREIEVEDEDDENAFTIRDAHYQQESHSTELPKHHQQQQSACRTSDKFEKRHDDETDEQADAEIFNGQSCQQKKAKESCNKYENFNQENLVSLEDELKAKIEKVALDSELDSLLTLMKLEQQLKDVSQLLLEQEDRLRQQAKKDKKQHSKPQDKQNFEQSCRLKQRQSRSASRDSDKVEQTFIIKSKYRQFSDVDDNEEEHLSNIEKSQSKKSRMQSQKSLKSRPESHRSSSSIVRRRDIVKSIENLVKEQKSAELRKEQKVCINRIPKVILSRSDANASPKKCFSSKLRAQKPLVRSHASSAKYGSKSRSGKQSPPKRGNVKVEEIKIEQVKRR